MRKLLIGVLTALLLAVPCRALDGGSVPFAGVDELYGAAREYGVSEDQGLNQGLQGVLSRAMGQLDGLLRRSVGTGMKLLAIVMLCAMAKGVCLGEGQEGTRAVELAGALAVTALTVNDMGSMIGLGRETIARMDDFASLLLPVMAALTAATGGVTGAVVRQGATVLCSELLISAIDALLLPLVYAYVAACCAYAAVGNNGLKRLAALLKGTVTALLTGFLLSFVAYLTASGALAGTADAAAVKAAKMTISRAIPVVGGILSDAAETLLVGAGVLRGTVGVVGLLVVLAICITPFLQLAMHYLVYKVAAALTATVAGPGLSELMDCIGGAFGLVLGMTGSCALILLISLVSAVKAVVPG